MEYFFIGNLVPAQRDGILRRDTKIPCLVCNKQYILGNMRMHVGRHILHGTCGQTNQRNEEVCYIYIYAQTPCLIPTQLGLEPCGFCGGDKCTVKLDRTGHERLKILSSCPYTYSSFNYEIAKLPSKSSPCTNIPIVCPFCSSSTSTRSIWKYNAVAHMTVNHPDELLPLEFLTQIHISLMEAELMKVDLDAVKSYRKLHNLIGSDDLPEETVSAMGDKRLRALSASSAGGSRKNPRLE